MKCLTNKQIQELIDGELTTNLSEKYHQHVVGCQYCKEQYDEQKTLAESIKGLINDAAMSSVRIPEFQIPKHTAINVKTRHIPLWVKVAAVLIPAFFVLKMANKPQEDFKPTAENIQMYEMCNSVDANTAFQENMIITTVTDENGKVVECEAN